MLVSSASLSAAETAFEPVSCVVKQTGNYGLKQRGTVWEFMRKGKQADLFKHTATICISVFCVNHVACVKTIRYILQGKILQPMPVKSVLNGQNIFKT